MNRTAQLALLDAMSGPAFLVDSDYRYRAFNEANRRTVRELYGSELELGASIIDVVASAEDRAALCGNIDRALTGETLTSGSWYGAEPGARRFYTITYAPVIDEGGVIGVAAIAIDATELLEAQAAVAVLGELVDSSDDAIMTWSADGSITSWGPGAERLTGFSAKEMLGHPIGRVVAPGHEAELVFVMEKIADGARVRHFATETPRRDGTLVDIELAVSPILSEDGMVVGGTAVARDVSGQHSIERALRLSEQKFEAAFRASPDAVNINRVSDGLYMEVNSGFTDLTGYSAEDVEGKTSVELSIWDDTADRDRLVAALRERGWADHIEAQFRRKDGSVTTAEMSARIISVEGVPCILSVTRDISESRRAQAELEASYDRLERMSRDVVQTLGRVVETRDPYTRGHEERAAGLCRLIATEMGMPEADVAFLETAALVHDVGKLSIPAEILTKPGTLSRVEHDLIREHPRNSYEILKDIAFDRPIADIVLQHHERMDGSGYPNGLSGDEISMHARVLAVADVVEAMATHRPYRPALGLAAAIEELRSNPAKYDPTVVAAFLALCDRGDVTL